MKTKTQKIATGALLFALAGTGAAQADIAVNLNGQPLATSVSPLQVGGRTLVPMRDIFEALGAQLSWNPVAQTITAQKDLTTIQLAINNRNALVNGRNVVLEQAATLINGRTFVPLRFVAEATGAQVDWNQPLQLVSIRSNTSIARNPLPATPTVPAYNVPTTPNILPAPEDFGGTQVANARTISVPNGVVIPVQMDQAISSATARVGQTFTATVISRRLGDSEFPAGTKIQGRIVESRPSQNNQPGVLDFDWTQAILPDGTRIPLRGQLTSLDATNVQMAGGRIVANGAQKSNRLKVIGIGAGAGFVLGRVLDTNSTVTTILGAAGGYLLGRARDRKAEEALIAANTTLGVELVDPVRYADTDNYFGHRSQFLRVSDTTGRFNARDYGFDETTAVPRGDREAIRAQRRAERAANRAANQSQIDNGIDDPYSGYEYSDTYPANLPVNQAPVIVGDIYDQPVRDNQQVAGYQQISIPGGSVVPVTINERLTSATARVGQTFTASVLSQQMGDSEFPAGTTLTGRVIEAMPQRGNEPGTLDLEFRQAVLPDGTRVPLRGELVSLDDKSVQTRGGRIVAPKSGNNDRLKVIGIGAAAGFVVGRVLKKDGVLPSVLGALGGYLFSTQRGDKPADAVVPQGTRLGVRLNNDVRYRDTTQYATYRTRYLRQ